MSKRRQYVAPPEERYPLQPSATLLTKLGSIVVHYEEFLSPTGHPFDKSTAEELRRDPEVDAWFRDMTSLAFLPVKRRG